VGHPDIRWSIVSSYSLHSIITTTIIIIIIGFQALIMLTYQCICIVGTYCLRRELYSLFRVVSTWLTHTQGCCSSHETMVLKDESLQYCTNQCLNPTLLWQGIGQLIHSFLIDTVVTLALQYGINKDKRQNLLINVVRTKPEPLSFLCIQQVNLALTLHVIHSKFTYFVSFPQGCLYTRQPTFVRSKHRNLGRGQNWGSKWVL
jgi:hypothetical protein